jgi:hypothetical protein
MAEVDIIRPCHFFVGYPTSVKVMEIKKITPYFPRSKEAGL